MSSFFVNIFDQSHSYLSYEVTQTNTLKGAKILSEIIKLYNKTYNKHDQWSVYNSINEMENKEPKSVILAAKDAKTLSSSDENLLVEELEIMKNNKSDKEVINNSYNNVFEIINYATEFTDVSNHEHGYIQRKLKKNKR